MRKFDKDSIFEFIKSYEDKHKVKIPGSALKSEFGMSLSKASLLIREYHGVSAPATEKYKLSKDLTVLSCRQNYINCIRDLMNHILKNKNLSTKSKLDQLEVMENMLSIQLNLADMYNDTTYNEVKALSVTLKETVQEYKFKLVDEKIEKLYNTKNSSAILR